MKKIFFSLLLITVLAMGVIFLIRQKSSNLNFFKNKTFQSTENIQTNLPTEKPVTSGVNLEIIEPKSGMILNTQTIKIKGKTAPLAEVYINDKETKADEKGNFSFDYVLDEGENILTIVASDENGNYAEREIVVNLQTQ